MDATTNAPTGESNGRAIVQDELMPEDTHLRPPQQGYCEASGYGSDAPTQERAIDMLIAAMDALKAPAEDLE